MTSSVNGIKGEVAALSAKANDFEKAVGTMDRSLTSLNTEIEQLEFEFLATDFQHRCLKYFISPKPVTAHEKSLAPKV